MLDFSVNIAMGILILSALFSFIRLIKGPSLQDRVVAIDLIAIVVAGIIIVFVFLSDQARYLDIVVVISVIIFLGTVAIAKFLNKEKK